MTIQEALDRYCLARSQRQCLEQLDIANLMVDEIIPELIERLGQTIIDRNRAQSKITLQDGNVF